MGARLIKAAIKNKKKRMDSKSLILVFLFILFIQGNYKIPEHEFHEYTNNTNKK